MPMVAGDVMSVNAETFLRCEVGFKAAVRSGLARPNSVGCSSR
jgi:hypothetical protein